MISKFFWFIHLEKGPQETFGKVRQILEGESKSSDDRDCRTTKNKDYVSIHCCTDAVRPNGDFFHTMHHQLVHVNLSSLRRFRTRFLASAPSTKVREVRLPRMWKYKKEKF